MIIDFKYKAYNSLKAIDGVTLKFSSIRIKFDQK